MNKKPYSTSDPTLKTSIVCFVDILGFSQLSLEALKDNNGNEFLFKLRNALSNAYKQIRENSKGWKNEERYSIKIFTDNIVIGYPLNRFEFDFGESELSRIFRMFSTFQANLAIEGFLSRGGIAVGDHYMDDDIVFGDALLKAVNKDKPGGPPNISLDQSAVDILQRHLGFYGNSDFAPQKYQLLEDADGTIFINYLTEAFVAFPDAGIFFEIIEKHRNTIINGFVKYKTNPGVRAKYEWAARYHNYVCDDVASQYSGLYFDENTDPIDALNAQEAQKLLDYKINIEDLSSKPQKLSLKPIPPRNR